MLVRLSCARGVRRDRDTKNQREEFAVLHRETECAVHPIPQVATQSRIQENGNLPEI